MNIDIRAKIHNKFKIEVKNINTGEVREGRAENIVLDNFFTSANVFGGGYYVGRSIKFGNGSGTISPTRTTLFNFIGSKDTVLETSVFQHPPLVSSATHKIILTPSEFVGTTITEVGVGGQGTDKTIYTHALIKDAEGNDLILGPKTSEEEITIYATIYATVDIEEGITLTPLSKNNLLQGLTGMKSTLRNSSYGTAEYYPRLKIAGIDSSKAQFNQNGIGKITAKTFTFLRNQVNGKVKNISLFANLDLNTITSVFNINLETLAGNNSPMWGGYAFERYNIGIGDGTTKEFALPWDEAILGNGEKGYVDGLEVSGVTFTDSTISFDVAPGAGKEITGDWYVKYMPKDNNHEIRCEFSIIYGEGAPL